VIKYLGDVFSYVIVFPVFTIMFLSKLSSGIKIINFFELDTLFLLLIISMFSSEIQVENS
jgi:succinate-acetate transporter protein